MKKIALMDTILRDAHQSLIATRMSIADMRPAFSALDQAGYDSLEVWGGATFDSCLRFLNEDPWERLRELRKGLPNTKLSMLLRGQNILGYRHYPDDVLDHFVKLSIKNGIDVLRVFDALNDMRNLEQSVRSIKKYGGICELAICYTISDIHTVDYYLNLTREFLTLEPDRLAIKDMAGILTPQVAHELVRGIRRLTNIPIHVHTHATAGISEMTYLAAAGAGCDIIDTALSPFAGGSSQAATESMHIALSQMGYDTGIKIDVLQEAVEHFQTVKEKYIKNGKFNPKLLSVEPKALIYQVPGGMLSNLLSQLTEAKQEHLYSEVLNEVPRVRADLGYPPLVTPMSQMVGTQAVMNVMTGERYKMIPQEIKDYVSGQYGRPPVAISKEIIEKIIGNKEVMTGRPADALAPGFDALAAEISDLAETEEDILSYALFPQQARDFFQGRKDPFAAVPVQEIQIV